MAMEWIERLTGSLDDKKRWRQYKERKEHLPAPYRTATDGLERYFLYAGSIVKGDALVQMLEDLVELMEGAASDGTPVRGVVGDAPTEFAEAFIANYADAQWVDKERKRLEATIERAAAESD